jgi:chlorobactene glucosyltransferase
VSAGLLPALPWALPFLALVRLGRREPRLLQYGPRRGRPLSLIIPARNEATTIATLLSSLGRSDYAPLEIIVVDDRSTDATASVVAQFAAGDPRIRLIHGDPLPDGWYGKPWACLQGARAATGELLVFTDADTRHEPALLAHAAGALEAEHADLVTAAPRQLTLTFWERIIMPQVWALLGTRYHPRAVNRARRARDVIANGQFILVTRDAYERAGTHAAVRGEVAEDLALAQTFFGKRMKLFFAFAESLMETRMYQSLPQLIEGWSKNVYLGGRRSFPDEPVLRALMPAMLVLAMLFWLLPPAALLAGLLPAPAVAAVALSVLFWMTMCYGMRVPAIYGLGYPLGAAMLLYIVTRSTWRGAGRVEWRGRVYTAARKRAG